MFIKHQKAISITVYDQFDEIPKEDVDVLKRAIEAREKAYAPYSEFLVGAAVQLENGKIITGANQENAAYPSGLCAERVAIFAAGANYPDVKIKTIAISSRNAKKVSDSPNSSCGACRQSMLEYELKQSSPIRVYFYGEEGEIWQLNSVAELLPLYFDPKAL